MVYTSKLPSTELPKDKTLFDILFNNGLGIPEDHLAFVDTENPDKRLTYGEVRTQVLKAAAGFQREFDFKKGDVITICANNDIYYPVLLHSAVCAGGATATIDNYLSAESIEQNLDTVQPKVVIADKDTLARVLTATKNLGIPESNILLLEDHGVDNIRTIYETILSGDELATPYACTFEEFTTSPAFLYFTSGTTGRQKAVIIPQSTVYGSINLNPGAFGCMVSLAYAKFHHGSSLMTTMNIFLASGTTSYIIPNYSLEKLCEVIEKYKVSIFMTQPFIIAALAKDSIVKKYDVSSLKVLLCGGAALDASVIRLVRERLGIHVFNGYGMTEALGMFVSAPGINMDNNMGTLGANMSAKIVDEDGNEVPTGEEGELLVKGPTVTKGYYRSPELTAALFDEDGFIRTGDLFRCDEKELFHFIDRKSDLIKYLLYHIRPSEIENILITHPKVTECAVIGVYSQEETTEHPRAYVRLIDGERHSEAVQQEILEYVNSRVDDTKRLRAGVVIVDEFPRTGSGKIQRRTLRQNANAAPVKTF